MGQNDPVVGQILHFGPFPLIKSTKGVPKRWKTNPHQIYSLKTRMIYCHKGSVAILFWDEKRLWLGSGGLTCENPVPKFEQESHPDHWGGLIDPKLCGPSSYVNQTWSASKKSHFRTFAPSTPSGTFGDFPAKHTVHTLYLGLARTIYMRCIYGIFGREITKYTVIYGVFIRFWPTLTVFYNSGQP
jgi:hypothetical protein